MAARTGFTARVGVSAMTRLEPVSIPSAVREGVRDWHVTAAASFILKRFRVVGHLVTVGIQPGARDREVAEGRGAKADHA
jgi:hypothetical protein